MGKSFEDRIKEGLLYSVNTSQPNGGIWTIYADYQATTPVDPRVLEGMTPYWIDLFGNPHSNDHVVGWRSAR